MNIRKVISFTVGELVDLTQHNVHLEKHRIKSLWTLYDEQQVLDNAPFNPFTGGKVTSVEQAVLQHERGVFLEDYVHDWKIVRKHYLDYNSHIVRKGSPIKIILELAETSSL